MIPSEIEADPFGDDSWMRRATESEVVRLIAHRGAGHGRNDPDGPAENTLAAVEYGFAAGADAVEVDVWVTSDGVPILHHDRTTDRTTDEPGLDVTQTPYSRLSRLSAGAWKSSTWQNAHIPTLAEAVRLVPPGAVLTVEIEEGPQVVPGIRAVLNDSELADEQVMIITYNLDTATEARQIMPEHATFWIIDTIPRWQIGGWAQGHRRGRSSTRAGYDDHTDMDWIISQAMERGLSGIDTLFSYPPDLPVALGESSLKWVVWTANSPVAVRQCLSDGVWGITTDNTAQVRGWLNKWGFRTATQAEVMP